MLPNKQRVAAQHAASPCSQGLVPWLCILFLKLLYLAVGRLPASVVPFDSGPETEAELVCECRCEEDVKQIIVHLGS